MNSEAIDIKVAVISLPQFNEMILPILFLVASVVVGEPLSKEENEKLQRTCGRPEKQSSPSTKAYLSRVKRSLHGIPSRPDDAPWVVSITVAAIWFPNMTQVQFNDSLSQMCTGSLISNRHIITAGHCIGWEDDDCDPKETPIDFNPEFKLKNIQRLQVIIGSECAAEETCKYAQMPFTMKYARNVSKVFMPSYFMCNKDIIPADVAVFELEEEVPFDENLFSVCLSEHDSQVGDNVEMFGYGDDPSEDFKRDSGFLKKHETIVTECEGNSTEPDFAFCTKAAGLSLACHGDSGSGMIHRDTSGRPFLTGVLSGGPHCERLLKLQRTGMVEEYEHNHDDNARVSPHLSWICLATGVCAGEKATNDVIAWRQLRNPPPWFRTIEKLRWEEMFV